jgi:hypothetical protein
VTCIFSEKNCCYCYVGTYLTQIILRHKLGRDLVRHNAMLSGKTFFTAVLEERET